jgi:hypothetical protein
VDDGMSALRTVDRGSVRWANPNAVRVGTSSLLVEYHRDQAALRVEGSRWQSGFGRRPRSRSPEQRTPDPRTEPHSRPEIRPYPNGIGIRLWFAFAFAVPRWRRT